MKLIFIFLIWSVTVWAQENASSSPIRLEGEVDFFFELAQRPTAIQGQSRFDFGLFELSPQVKIDDQISLHTRFVLSEERSSNEKNYLSEVQNAYVSYRNRLSPSWTHELGLVRPEWIVWEGLTTQFGLFGLSARGLAWRYALIGEGDLGYQAYWKSERWQLVGGFVNGEENKNDEQGPNKEASLGALWKGDSLQAQFWLSMGRVDRVDPSLSDKNHILARIEKVWGRFGLGLEGFYARDPSLDLENNKRFDGIMFTELSQPQSITTTGGRVDLTYQLADNQRVLLRYDHLRPQWDRKRVESWEAAWVKKESQHMAWGGFYEKTEYGAKHSSQAKLKELIRLGAQITF